MHSITRQPRLLVKMSGAPETLRFTLPQERDLKLAFEPLFRSLGQATPALNTNPQWYVMAAQTQADEVNSWDLCHRLLAGGFGVTGMPSPVFAEPDFEQQWIFGTPSSHALALTSPSDAAAGPDPKLPFVRDNLYWFRDADHSQLELARRQAGNPSAAKRVRIAHFDTGYDPAHSALPRFLRRDLQRNFVDQQFPNDASDRSSGFVNNLGHGTGTIGILALGGAPQAEVVPVRIANSVALFRNSAVAQAFDYAHSLSNGARTRIHVITMSMGGLASRAWAEAVHQLYEEGVFIVAAAGNNFGNLPTHHMVYPARFGRVVAVTTKWNGSPRSCIRCITVSLPAPDGPEITISSGCG